MTRQPAPQRAVASALRAALRPLRDLTPGALLVVGVSGGADSLCLLHALAQLAPKLGLRLHAATLDHGLRGAAGAEDAAFVQQVCAGLSVPCTSQRRPVAEYLAAHPDVTSVEAAARAVRYRFFSDVARATGAVGVATGHTSDDQAETVLLHLVRGAGLEGLAGMSPDTQLPVGGGAIRVLRPLLTVSRAQTHAYCAAAGLTPREDATNASLDYTRNRLRHDALPALQGLNPQVTEALNRLAAQAQQEAGYWRDETARSLAETASAWNGGLALDRNTLRRMPVPLAARVVRAAAQQVRPGDTLSAEHTAALLNLLPGASGRATALPGALYAFTTYRHLVLSAAPPDLGPAPPPTAMTGPGSLRWGPWRLTVELLSGSIPPAAAAGPWHAHLDARMPLEVRARVDGDRFRPLGVPTLLKLQDLLVNAHLPAPLRNHLPLIAASDGTLLWVPGLRVAETAKVTPATEQTLAITVTPATPQLRALLQLWEGRSYNGEVVAGPETGRHRSSHRDATTPPV